MNAESTNAKLSPIYSEWLATFYEHNSLDLEGHLRSQKLCAHEVVNSLGEIAGNLHLGDEHCSKMVEILARQSKLGFRCESTTKADFMLTSSFSTLLSYSHPGTSLLLRSNSLPCEIGVNADASIYRTEALNMLEVIDASDDPGLLELTALLNFSMALSRVSSHMASFREQISLLCKSEAILSNLESRDGNIYVEERARLSVVARNHLDGGVLLLPRYKQFIERAGSLGSNEEPSDYQWLAQERLNPMFKLMLEHSRTRNHLGSDLFDLLSEIISLVNRIDSYEKTKEMPWLFDEDGGLLSVKRDLVMRLAINTFQVPVESLSTSLSKPGNNLSWFKDFDELAETSMMKKINNILEQTEHNADERKIAYTNLAATVVKLSVKDFTSISVNTGARKALDELLDQIAPFAELAAVPAMLSDGAGEVWAGYVLRNRSDLINTLTLESVGEHFSTDLGL